MNASLYVYNIQNLKLMKETMSQYRFISIAYLMNINSSVDDIIEMDLSEVNCTIVDITNLIQDYNVSRLFSERYLWAIINNPENIHFSIQSNYFERLREMYPYFFNEDEINYEFDSNVTEDPNRGEVWEARLSSPLILHTYRNPETIKDLYEKGLAVSLAHLIQEGEGISFKYNIEDITRTIKEKEISYIDISSLVETLKLRKDLMFQFEMLIYKLVMENNVGYSIKEKFKNEALEFFPLLFTNDETIDKYTDEKDYGLKKQEINVCQINCWVDKINDKLKGHTFFKEDFRHNLLKFSILNRMSDRKILSAFLCGESGIGKTEFAKVVSDVMYPNEMLIKINFGNYSTEGVLNSLIGSPLGYVGSEEGGELINKIADSKSKIILIDEFERATPSVYNFFYELLEDGRFTDRHGIEHDLDGYIIVFTSNMTESQYQKHIPESLKSRFDMVYGFEGLDADEKMEFINRSATLLIANLKKEFGFEVDFKMITEELNELQIYKNLRDIRRKVEDIVFKEFFESTEGNDVENANNFIKL